MSGVLSEQNICHKILPFLCLRRMRKTASANNNSSLPPRCYVFHHGAEPSHQFLVSVNPSDFPLVHSGTGCLCDFGLCYTRNEEPFEYAPRKAKSSLGSFTATAQ